EERKRRRDVDMKGREDERQRWEACREERRETRGATRRRGRREGRGERGREYHIRGDFYFEKQETF
ncbi:unnamed protein product, partial [Dovyalis caffra]